MEPYERLKAQKDAIVAKEREEVECLKAECAAMRETLEDIESLAEHEEYSLPDMCYQLRHVTRTALKSTAGAQWLERYKRMEKVIEAARAVRHFNGWSAPEKFEKLNDALDALEETP